MSMDESPKNPSSMGNDLDVERGSDVPISTQIYWQLAYQIDSARLLPGSRLPPVRELGAALRVNPNTIRAVYRRLADAGYVSSRHGAGTHVADRPPQRRGAEALAGLVSELSPEVRPEQILVLATSLRLDFEQAPLGHELRAEVPREI